jgi:hypothetical protein
MLIAVVMLVVWGIGTVLGWPGWIHGLFTAGVFLLIRAIVTRSQGTGNREQGTGHRGQGTGDRGQ